jgi:hypothetical protein
MKRWFVIASMMVVACSAPYIRVATAGDAEKLCPTASIEVWWSTKASAQDLTAALNADPRPVTFRGPSHGIEAVIEHAFVFGAQDLTAAFNADPRPVRFRGPIREIDAPLVAQGR